MKSPIIPLKSVFSVPYILLALFLSSLAFGPRYLSSLDIIERRLLDISFQIRGNEPPHPDIAIIEINDESLHRIGSWPWPRTYHAALLSILRQVKPSVVFFDMLFSEHSTEVADGTFSQAIRDSGNVLLSFYFSASSPKEMQSPEGMPLDIFKEYSKGLGYVNVFPDADGHIREIVLRHSDQKKTYLHSSLAIASAHAKYSPREIRKIIPDRGYLINFPCSYQEFNVVPYEYLTSTYGQAWAKPLHESLRGKAILVGHTAAGTAMDLKPTVFSNQYPGIGIQASMLHTLLSKSFIVPLPLVAGWGLLFLFCILIIYICRTTTPLQGFIYTLSALVIVFEITQVLFIYKRIWFPFGSFLISASAIFTGLTLFAFVKVYVEREVMWRELSVASRIQTNFLIKEMPEIPGIQLAALTIPARHVGGDLYDVLVLGEGRCGISIGDVSGKGVPAALFMSRAISEFRREVHAATPAAVIKNLNKKLSEGGFSGLFITLLYLILDPRNKKMIYANGGHDPILYYQKSRHQVDLLMTETGGPLGIDANADFDEKEVLTLSSGDIVMVESDGIKESMNMKKEIFGLDRLKAAILEAAHLDSQGIIKHLQKRVQEFVRDAPQHDDMTLVCAKIL